MGFFDDIKAGAKDLKDSTKSSLEIAKLKDERDALKKLETAVYAAIGKAVVALEGAEKFGADGTKLIGLQEQIKAKEAEIAEAEAKQK